MTYNNDKETPVIARHFAILFILAARRDLRLLCVLYLYVLLSRSMLYRQIKCTVALTLRQSLEIPRWSFSDEREGCKMRWYSYILTGNCRIVRRSRTLPPTVAYVASITVARRERSARMLPPLCSWHLNPGGCSSTAQRALGSCSAWDWQRALVAWQPITSRRARSTRMPTTRARRVTSEHKTASYKTEYWNF